MLANPIKLLFCKLLDFLTMERLLWLTTNFVTLEELNIDIVKNRNIGNKHLGGSGLHVNPHGTTRLALTLKATIRKLWSTFGDLGNPEYKNNVTSVSSDHNNVLKLNHCNKKQPEKIRNKFEMLTSLVTNEIDVLLLSETKKDETFPLEQFLISGFAKPLRLDRNSRVCGIMLFIRDNIPLRLLKPGNLPSNTEALFIEINLCNKNGWLAAVTI